MNLEEFCAFFEFLLRAWGGGNIQFKIVFKAVFCIKMISRAFAAGGGVGGFAAGTHGGDCLAKSVNVACGNDKSSFGRDGFGAPASVAISCDWRSAGERFDVDGRKIIFVSWVDKQICLVVKRDEFVNILRAFDAANALRERGDLRVG